MDATRRRVLVVDDYADALEMWALYLRMRGYAVTTASDGLSAVEMARRDLPDVVILDLDLPGITGFEAARRLRADPRTSRIPLVAATGYSHLKQLEQALRSGFQAVLVKPCEPSALVDAIDEALSRRDSDRIANPVIPRAS